MLRLVGVQKRGVRRRNKNVATTPRLDERERKAKGGKGCQILYAQITHTSFIVSLVRFSQDRRFLLLAREHLFPMSTILLARVSFQAFQLAPPLAHTTMHTQFYTTHGGTYDHNLLSAANTHGCRSFPKLFNPSLLHLTSARIHTYISGIYSRSSSSPTPRSPPPPPFH